MNRNQSDSQKTAGLIRYSCGILFMALTFCYLFFLQGEILAEAQFVYSKGATHYNLLLGAIIASLVLQCVQCVVARVSFLPPKWHALSYFPSMLMLAIFTDANTDVLVHFSFGSWVWAAPLLLVLYAFSAFAINRMERPSDAPPPDIRAELYPNFIILLVSFLIAASIPHTTDVYHYELKTERLILEDRYEEAARVGERSLKSSRRLTQLRMYALSQLGLLPERLLDYPQYYKSAGLLTISDTLPYYRLSSQDICRHLGAYSGRTVRNAARYYEVMLADTIYNQHTVDYYLCSLLLERNLSRFRQALPVYYDISGSIPHAVDSLPRAYREALLISGNRRYAPEGKVVVGADTLYTFTDRDFIESYKEYADLRHSLTDPVERTNRTRRAFGNTVWWYVDN